MAGVICAAAVSCGGGDKPGTTEPPPATPAALDVMVPDSIVAGKPFSLRVEARTASGQPDLAWRGAVSLNASAGRLAPSTVQLANGSVTLQVTLTGGAGTLTVTAAVGSVQAARTTLALSGEPAVRLEVTPRAFLLPRAGDNIRLGVRAFDANDRLTEAVVAWQSSNPAMVTVSPTGVATAVVSAGSAQITAVLVGSGGAQVAAAAGGGSSAPALGVVTQPPPGALLVADNQVVSAPVPTDAAAPYAVGWHYRVRLTGVTPTIGQLVLATGEAPLGGRVVSVTPVGTEQDVTLELIPVHELLPALSLNESIPLAVPAPSASAGGVGKALAPPDPLEAGEWYLGPFKCKDESGVPVPMHTSPPALDINPSMTLDLVHSVVSGVERFVVRGGLFGTFSSTVKLTEAVEAKLECKLKAWELPIPIGGVLAVFFSGKIPVGVGFGFETKLDFGDIGYELELNAAVTIEVGAACSPGCGPVLNVGGTTSGSFKPLVPTLVGDLQWELSGGAFVWSELAFGPPLFASLQLKAFEAKGGVKQELKAATARVQANDPAYAARFQLVPYFEAGASSKVSFLGDLLGVTLAELKWAPAIPPLATSPRGTLDIVPAKVYAKTATNPGDSATFVVDVDPVVYFIGESVEAIEIYSKKPASSGPFTLEPAPGACARITPSGPMQTLFRCKTVFAASDIGTKEFYAFVQPKIWSLSLPFLVEINDNSRAAIEVDTGTVQVAVSPSTASMLVGQTKQFTATVTGSTNTAVTWTATGGTITAGGLFTAGTGGVHEVRARSNADTTKSAIAQVTVTPPGAVEVVGTNQTDAGANTGCDDKKRDFGWIVVVDSVAYDANDTCSGTVAGSTVTNSGVAESEYAVRVGALGELIITGSGATGNNATVSSFIQGQSRPQGTVVESRIDNIARFTLTAPANYQLTGNVQGTLNAVVTGPFCFQGAVCDVTYQSGAASVVLRQIVPVSPVIACASAGSGTGCSSAGNPVGDWQSVPLSSSGQLQPGTYHLNVVVRSNVIANVVLSATASAAFAFTLTLRP